jgi:lysophospholipase L1-like esterase
VILAVLGDSLCVGFYADGAYRHDPDRAYPVTVAAALGMHAHLFAAPGATIAQIAASEEAWPAAELLIVSAGTNDLWEVALGSIPLDAVLTAWDALIVSARARAPAARAVVVGLRDYTVQMSRFHKETRASLDPALRGAIHAFNRHILHTADSIAVDLAARAGAYDFDLFPDSVHPSLAGVSWIAEAVLEALRRPPAETAENGETSSSCERRSA